MEDNKKYSTWGSIKFIFSYVKKYAFTICFIIIFILITTYFQVISPKIMGEAIDNMITYVGEYQVEQIANDIEDGKGLTDKQKDTLIEKGDFTKEQEETIVNATGEDIQTLYNVMQTRNKVFEKSNDSILNGKGFSQAQQDYLMNLDIKDEYKYMLMSVDAQIVLEQYMNYIPGLTDAEKDGIAGIKAKDAQSLYDMSLVREDAIELNTEQITNELGYNQEQIDFINDSKLTRDEKDTLLNQSTDELTQAYGRRHREVDSNAAFKIFTNSIILLIAVYVMLSIVMLVYNVLMAVVAGKSTRDMRKGLFGKIEELSIRFFDQSNAGDLLSRFTNDIDNISNAMNQSIMQVISQGAMLFGILIIMFNEDHTSVVLNIFGMNLTINSVIVWVMLIFAVGAIVIAGFIIRVAKKHVSLQQKKLGSLNGYIDERISGQKVIISYGLEQETLDAFDEYNEDLKNTSVKGQIYSGVLMPFMQGVGLVNLGMLVFMGSVFVIDGTMTIGLLTAFIQYSQRFFNPLAQVVAQYNMLELAATGGARVKEVVEVKAEVVNQPGAKDITGIEGKVSLENVNFGYYENKLVLKDINIDVNKGEMIALVGPTGSGKTTVMNLMNRFYDVTSGDIKIDNKSIKDITLETLRANVGIVLQESIMFKGTIRDNILYGNRNATDEEVINAAKAANIHDFIMTLDGNYDMIVDNNTSVFSTGQKQLMSIARTILTDPDLLILDEATSNVDTVTEAKIQKAMENVLHGRTSFVIAHRLKTILNADTIIVLKDGEIIEKGSHKELLKLEGFYAELYHNQFVVE